MAPPHTLDQQPVRSCLNPPKTRTRNEEVRAKNMIHRSDWRNAGGDHSSIPFFLNNNIRSERFSKTSSRS